MTFLREGATTAGRRGDRGRSAKGARPELAGGDRVGVKRVEEQQRGARGGGALPAAAVAVVRGGGGETLTAAAGVGRRGTIDR